MIALIASELLSLTLLLRLAKIAHGIARSVPIKNHATSARMAMLKNFTVSALLCPKPARNVLAVNLLRLSPMARSVKGAWIIVLNVTVETNALTVLKASNSAPMVAASPANRERSMTQRLRHAKHAILPVHLVSVLINATLVLRALVNSKAQTFATSVTRELTWKKEFARIVPTIVTIARARLSALTVKLPGNLNTPDFVSLVSVVSAAISTIKDLFSASLAALTAQAATTRMIALNACPALESSQKDATLTSATNARSMSGLMGRLAQNALITVVAALIRILAPCALLPPFSMRMNSAFIVQKEPSTTKTLAPARPVMLLAPLAKTNQHVILVALALVKSILFRDYVK